MLGVGLHTSTLQTTTSEIFLLSNNQYHVSRVPDTERSLWYCFLLIKWSFRTYLDRCIRIFRGFSSLERKSVFQIIISFYSNHKLKSYNYRKIIWWKCWDSFLLQFPGHLFNQSIFVSKQWNEAWVTTFMPRLHAIQPHWLDLVAGNIRH